MRVRTGHEACVCVEGLRLGTFLHIGTLWTSSPIQDHIQLGAPSLHPQDVQLPVPVQKDKAKAAYNPVTKTLSVSIPCL